MKKFLILIAGLCTLGHANAQDSFFTNPADLKPWDKGTYDLRWVHPDLYEFTKNYDSVMVDQPEVLISDESKYNGAKGDHLKQLADVARLTMIERIEDGGWNIVDEPGPNVVYIRWALSDLYLQKKKRGLLSYTPVGMVVHTTTQAAIQDLWKKIDIAEVGLKIEYVDSTSGQVIAAGRGDKGARKAKGKDAQLVSWEDLYAMFRTIGEQTRCRLDSNKLPESEQREDCNAILIEPEEG